jgi:multiple antibiotic resistance protein
MIQKIVNDFVTLFVVLDPVGAVAIFLAATANLAPDQRRRAAVLGILYSFGVLVCFVVAGALILIEMGIPLHAFRFAGAILLLLYGIEMTLGRTAPGEGFVGAAGGLQSLAIYPIAIPAIAGPGSMLTVVLLTDNLVYSVFDQVVTTVMMAVALSVILLCLLMANSIMRVIGIGGANVLRRVMGILLCSIAVNMGFGAIEGWLTLLKQ